MTRGSKNLIILRKVDSTNNYAMGMVQKGGLKSGDAVMAMEQTNGKGRRGKSWESNWCENVLLTVVHEMQWLPVYHQFYLTVAVAVGCYQFISGYVKNNISIKWPNDIYIDDKKAGGVLIENIIRGYVWQWSLSGIGININQEDFQVEGRSPISLKMITGKKYDIKTMTAELHAIILQRIDDLKRGNFPALFELYNQHLFAKNKMTKFRKGNSVFESTVKSVTP
ncbi:MAG: biotin--[acetyl-CoA-carboxylase] ligase, partial [Ginsengibacter sp.]